MSDKKISVLNNNLISIKDEEAVKHTITTYLKRLAHAQISLKQPHLEHICSSKVCSYNTMRYENLIRRMKTFHCKIKYYRISPEFINIFFEDQMCTVKVISKERLKFDNLKDETLRSNVHEFDLARIKNKWMIFSDKDNDSARYFLRKSNNNSAIDFQLDILKSLLKRKLSREKFNIVSKDNELLNREKMKQYQTDNWNKRPNEWGNFNDMGGDCTNYASQVVYAGGAPMINSDSYKWYYYGYGNRAPSWTGVEQFYDFLLKNKAQGVHGFDLPSNLELKTGDIIQVDLDGDGIFNHTSVVYDPLGYMGILPTITSHSLDRFNEPILTFDFTDIRWIHLE